MTLSAQEPLLLTLTLFVYSQHFATKLNWGMWDLQKTGLTHRLSVVDNSKNYCAGN